MFMNIIYNVLVHRGSLLFLENSSIVLGILLMVNLSTIYHEETLYRSYCAD
jgi:hypothetical protein